jgi:hypothetical protein
LEATPMKALHDEPIVRLGEAWRGRRLCPSRLRKN